jgi:2-dehydro-3-deoxyphosphogluconate aldolase/(4S)-4-hydroxy-2-oxoglutarate aldolase
MPELNDWFDTTFTAQPVMAILRGFVPARTVELSERAWDLGLDCVEVPIQTPDALPALRAAVAAGRERGREVGAGTVITVEQLAAAVECGARFTVAPGLDSEIVRASAERGVPHLPGVSTPSEIQQALRLGLRWVKAFPASELGPAWFSAMAGPFPDVRFVATGGINGHNAREYLDAGAKVVAVGSALSDPAQLDLLSELLTR